MSVKFMLLILFFPFVRAQTKVCISGSSKFYLNGVYQFKSFDPITKAAIYYNPIANEYLFPNPNISIKQYIINTSMDSSNEYSTVDSYADPWYTTIDTTNSYYDIKHFHLNWMSYDNIHSNYSKDINMRLVQCDDICIFNAASNQTNNNGIYIWESFDLRDTYNGSRYYCRNCYRFGTEIPYSQPKYLFSRVIEITQNGVTKPSYIWNIGGDYNDNSTVNATCHFEHIHDNDIGHYINDVNDCKQWKWEYKYFDTQRGTFTQKWYNDDTIKVGVCDSSLQQPAPSLPSQICVIGSSRNDLNGIYKYNHFDYPTHGHVYFHHGNDKSISPRVPLLRHMPFQYMIHNADSKDAFSQPLDNWMFDMDGLFQNWTVNGTSDRNMRVVNCESVCLNHTHRQYFIGVYEWDHFDYSVNASAYNCDKCWNNEHDISLQASIQLDPVDNRYHFWWQIDRKGGQDYQCYTGFSEAYNSINLCYPNLNLTRLGTSNTWRQWTYSSNNPYGWHTEDIALVTQCSRLNSLIMNPPPTYNPTIQPTWEPTADPTMDPTKPTSAPTFDPTLDPTSEPSTEPTFVPTANPTTEPTNFPTTTPTTPTFEPTSEPTMEPTFQPTLHPVIPEATFNQNIDRMNLIIIASIVGLFLVVILILCMIRMHGQKTIRSKDNKYRPLIGASRDPEVSLTSKILPVSKPKIVPICIGKYEDESSEEAVVFPDLDGVKYDLEKIEKLAECFENFDQNLACFKSTLSWSKDELIEYLRAQSRDFVDNLGSYDCLLLFISSHGIREYIITSDLWYVELEVVYFIFSQDNTMRDIPRIFIIDCCRGYEENKGLYIYNEDNKQSPNLDDGNKYYTLSDYRDEDDGGGIMNDDGEYFGEHRCRMKVELQATPNCHIAKSNTKQGSHFTIKLIDEMINNYRTKTLSEMYDDTERILEDNIKQLPEAKFYHKTKHIKFEMIHDH